ncbi:MAG: PilZ domain-containing protein [Myxococcota bacterium]
MRSLRPEAEGATLDRFRVVTEPERRRIATGLAAKRSAVGLFSNDQLVLTASVVGCEADQVVLDAGPEDGRTEWRRVLIAPVVAVAFLDEVKVQFTAERLKLAFVTAPGQPRQRVLRAPFPDPLWRIQRRKGHRVRIGDEAKVFARVPWPDGTTANLRVEDLSVGGLGLAVAAHTPLPPIGTRWAVARLNVIRGEGQHLVPCGLTVCRTTRGTTTRPSRIGCAIDGLPLASARVLQELVIELERSPQPAR